jgi:hypothetical protein
LSKFSEGNIINVHKQNEFKYYEIGINKSKLQDLLSKYTSSSTEKTVDDYIDMMNEFWYLKTIFLCIQFDFTKNINRNVILDPEN